MKRTLYSNYKPSGVEWLGDVPEHWKVKRLKYLSNIRYGIGEPPEYVDDGIPLIRATNVNAGKIEAANLAQVNPDDIPTGRIVWLKTGDIIVVRSGAYTGDSSIIPEQYNGAIAGFDMVLSSTKANSSFLAYSLLSKYLKEGQIDLEKMRAAQPHLNAEELGNCIVFLPPPTEQQTIAAFLDCQTGKIDTLVEKKKRLVELLKEKRTALISHAVTKGLNPKAKMKPSGVEWLGDVPEHWEVAALRRYLHVKSGDMTSASDLIDEGYPVFGGNGFRGYIDKWNTEAKTIIIGRYGALCGNVRITEERTWATEHAFRVFALKEFYTEYFAQLLTMLDLNKFSARAAQPGLNSDIVRNNTVAIPPLNEQKAIAEYLDQETGKIDGLVAKVEDAIEKLKEYRTALISAAVTGKIDVRKTT